MNEPKQVYAAIASVMGAIGQQGIAKDRKNQTQGYAFRGIDDVYNALNALLAENKLVILPRVISRKQEERETQKGGVLFSVVVHMEFDVVHADGSSHTICTFGEAMDSADKATNKAMSAAYKYACMQMFCIPTEGDNDADAITPPPVKPRQQPAKDASWKQRPVEMLKERLRMCNGIAAVEEQARRFWEAEAKKLIALTDEERVAAQDAIQGRIIDLQGDSK